MKTRTKKPSSKPTKPNNRMLVPDEPGAWKLRISQRKGTKTRSPSLLVRCGCCDESVEIYHDEDLVEINGVIATPREWQRLLAPILRGKRD